MSLMFGLFACTIVSMKNARIAACLCATVLLPAAAFNDALAAGDEQSAGGTPVRTLSEGSGLKNTMGERRVLNRQKLGQPNRLSTGSNAVPASSDGLSGPEKLGENIPTPGKRVAIDRGAFAVAGEFSTPAAVFKVFGTPHFKLMYQRGEPPRDIAELAERLWYDAAFYYKSFPQKFASRKYAIFVIDSEDTYGKFGNWYAGFLAKGGMDRAANFVNAAWKDSAAMSIGLPSDMAVSNGVMLQARIFNMSHPGMAGGGQAGLWSPFRVHSIAGDLLKVEMETLKDFDSKGCYAISTGYAFFKEILYTGAAETSILGMESVAAVNSSGGFSGDARTWPDQLRRLVNKRDLKPSLALLYETRDDGATAEMNVLAYSFVRFLHSSPQRIEGWSNLLEQISSAGEIPGPNDLALRLGFPDAPALEAEWINYITGNRFR